MSGLARLIRGNALASLENVALWHERDISHSSVERIILPDSCLALNYILTIFTSVVTGLQVNVDRMRDNVELTRGLVFSQRALIALIDKGLSRQDAYKIVQNSAMAAWHSGRTFRELLGADAQVRSVLSDDELNAVFDYGYFLKEIDHIFARAGLSGSADEISADGQTLAPRSY